MTTHGRFEPVPFTRTHLPMHVGSVLAELAARLTGLAEQRAERRALRNLRRLDAHILRDIGLEPSAMDVLETTGHSPYGR